MIRLPGDPLLEARLTQAIEARLRSRRQNCREHSKQLEQALVNPSALNQAERLQFRLLQRQFTGRWVPGFPTAVRTGRFFIRAWRRLRWQT